MNTKKTIILSSILCAFTFAQGAKFYSFIEKDPKRQQNNYIYGDDSSSSETDITPCMNYRY